MNRFAVMVDAGYLLCQAVDIVSNRSSKKRRDLEIVDPAGLVALLIRKSKELLALDGKELLRVYWYDGVFPTGMTEQQAAMINVDDLVLRAGTVNGAGKQKGVDSLIVTELVELSSHHAICDAVLVTGDSDLAVGIDLAQRRGVRIAVLGVQDLTQGVIDQQSAEIRNRSDRVGHLCRADIEGLVRFKPAARKAASTEAPAKPSAPPYQRELTPDDDVKIGDAVRTFINAQENPALLRNAINATTQKIDVNVDRILIHNIFRMLARGELTNAEKMLARAKFRALLHELGTDDAVVSVAPASEAPKT
ncbi:NYN domain-containing protein [Piscinibacter sp. HJYY11]|uniref:NYN domain-containing protein n=1 Tax=Piscinibacter sp. HJYY11 TaxID=2801333 RepID=UPI00191F0FF7|nr:NYN domain-containing protein [Piscinibacter sp. HJYY11]MBL0729439.1 NYN domain-containing protein [Piscinibacter sp. HJYY11]